jgi:hypothetical protein
MKQNIKNVLYPFRKLTAKFVKVDLIPSENIIIRKTAYIITAKQIEGDYLEFGIFSGSSFIHSYHVIKDVFDEHRKRHLDREEKKEIFEKSRI